MTEAHTVMLVDDEPNVLASLSRILRKEAYAIVTAESGKKALEIMSEQPVHLVVSDMRMPEMTGAELLTEIKKKYPEVVRIILSGQAELDKIFEAINSGALYKYITKPVNFVELKVVIQKGLEKYALEQENRRLTAELKEKNNILQNMNAQLEQCVLERTTDLRARDKVLEFMLSYHSLEETLNFISETLSQTYSIPQIAMYVFDKGEGRLAPLSCLGFQEGGKLGGADELQTVISTFTSVEKEVEEVFNAQKPAVKTLSHNGSAEGTSSCLVPILFDKDSLGVIEFSVKGLSPEAIKTLAQKVQGFQKLAAISIRDHQMNNAMPEMEDNIDGILKNIGE